jgi:hypothetical protein
MEKPLLGIALATLLAGCVIYVGDDDGNAYGEDLDYEMRTQSLPASGLERLVAVTGAGTLEIIGEAGRQDIEFVAEIHARDTSEVQLLLEASGSSARLTANAHNGRRDGGWTRIDLLVRMPAELALDLEDGSGEININGLQGSVLINDGSGALFLDGAASVTIKDGSGEMIVENIAGNLDIDDGSGAIRVRNVGGTVTVNDGSGAIDINGAGGLNIINSGSGGLSIRDVQGPVSI